jgi:hypothetical protein
MFLSATRKKDMIGSRRLSAIGDQLSAYPEAAHPSDA